jgi:hypothetical protein
MGLQLAVSISASSLFAIPCTVGNSYLMTAQERGVRCPRVGCIVSYSMRTRYDRNFDLAGLRAILPTC